VTDAINHVIAGQDFPAASELLATHWNEVVSTGGLRTVEMWLMALPEHVITGDARLCLARAWTSFAKGALEEQRVDACVNRVQQECVRDVLSAMEPREMQQ